MSQCRNNINNIKNDGIFTIENEIYTSIIYSKSHWKLFNVFISAFILRLASGLIISWTFHFEAEYLSSDQVNGLLTIFYFGSICGAIIATLTILQIEKKYFNYTSGGFIIIHGLILLLSYKHLNELIVGNFLSGCSYGLITISSVIHASELSTNSIRGWNIASLQVGLTLGILIGLLISIKTMQNSLGLFWFWNINGIILIVCGILSLIGTYYFMIESPVFWIYKVDSIKARNVMLKSRNEIYETFEIVNDLEALNKYVNFGIENVYKYLIFVPFTLDKYLLFFKMSLLRISYALGIGLSLNLILKPYQTWLIGSSDGIIVYILLRFFTEIVIVILIDRFGRRWFLIVSAAGSGLILIIINGILINSQPSNEQFFSNYVFYSIAILIIFYQIFIGLGLGPTTLVLLSEVFDFYSTPIFNCLLFVLENSSLIIIIILHNTRSFNINAYIFIAALFQLLAGSVSWYFIKETKKNSILDSCKLFK